MKDIKKVKYVKDQAVHVDRSFELDTVNDRKSKNREGVHGSSKEGL